MRLAFLFFSLLYLCSVQAQEVSPHVAQLERPADVPKKNIPNYRIVDITYASMFFNINPKKRFIEAEVSLLIKSSVADQKELGLDLHDELEVLEVWWNGKELDMNNVSHRKHLLQLQLNTAISQTSVDSVRIVYAGEPPMGNHEGFSQGTHKSGSIVWTLSEPYSSRDWWPGQHTLVDKIDSLDMIFKLPKGNRAASNGILVRSEDHKKSHIDHWKHRHPIASYLVAFAATNYVSYSDFVPHEGKQIEVLNYVYPHYLDKAKKGTKHIVDIMSLFNKLFIPYPFADEKYGHAQFNWGGGMEHQTMSFMYNFTFGLQAHELAHQWFGDYVTCGSWKDIWLNEGFATYLEGLCYENGLGSRKFNDWLNGKNWSVCRLATGSLYVNDTTSVGRVFSSRLSYDKGALVLHMLRKQIGDDAFFSGVRSYLNDKQLQANFATTPDFKKHIEEASDENMDLFFEDWIYNESYPKYKLDWAQDTSGRLVIVIEQTSALKNGNLFELKVPVTLVGKDQEKKIWIYQNQKELRFETQVDFKVKKVKLNEDLDIITKDPQVINDKRLVINFHPDTKKLDLFVIPNPAKSSIEIFWKSHLQPDTIQIINGNGNTVDSKHTETDCTSLQINVDTLPTGVYIIKAFDSGKCYQTKFIKQ